MRTNASSVFRCPNGNGVDLYEYVSPNGGASFSGTLISTTGQTAVRHADARYFASLGGANRVLTGWTETIDACGPPNGPEPCRCAYRDRRQ
jgi:hypothetical protein